MISKKKLPIGVDIFEKLIRQDFYYVDKTGMIAELLNHWGEVNLFTRPRRFGKSLNMSMLKAFFEIGCDETLFDGLRIMQETELCEQYMGQFPVISISLKCVEGRTGVVIELKYARDGHLDAGCTAALRQIEEKQYESRLKNDGMRTIVKYGIACYKKRCRVAIGR